MYFRSGLHHSLSFYLKRTMSFIIYSSIFRDKRTPLRDPSGNRKKRLLLLVFMLLLSVPAFAYVGPGAGFAFLSSFLVLFLTFFLALFSFLSWPFRFVFRLIKGRKAYKKSLIDRLVILGLDGMDPILTEKYMNEGKLRICPGLKKGEAIHLWKPQFHPFRLSPGHLL